ncbi:MAG: hypothetical protein DME43_07545 [Verrucomicrobia bacterium]|nr:MAG: hypothetical protein DME43_07545 [Verrucomicrobiota bacterium]
MSVRNSSHHVEKENQQVIGLTRGRRQRFFVSNLKIDQPGASRLLVVDHIGHRSIAMRPAAAERVAFEIMGPPIFTAGCLQHS